jgi:hypothetical protein
MELRMLGRSGRVINLLKGAIKVTARDSPRWWSGSGRSMVHCDRDLTQKTDCQLGGELGQAGDVGEVGKLWRRGLQEAIGETLCHDVEGCSLYVGSSRRRAATERHARRRHREMQGDQAKAGTHRRSLAMGGDIQARTLPNC